MRRYPLQLPHQFFLFSLLVVFIECFCAFLLLSLRGNPKFSPFFNIIHVSQPKLSNHIIEKNKHQWGHSSNNLTLFWYSQTTKERASIITFNFKLAFIKQLFESHKCFAVWCSIDTITLLSVHDFSRTANRQISLPPRLQFLQHEDPQPNGTRVFQLPCHWICIQCTSCPCYQASIKY